MKLNSIFTSILLVLTIYSAHAQITVTPKRAFDYYNEIGVNTHLRWDTSVYYTKFNTIIYPELQKLGIRNLRDELPADQFLPSADTAVIRGRFLKLHDSLGINMCWVLTLWKVVTADSSHLRDSAGYLSVLENSPALQNTTKYIEGYNEPDMNIYNYYPVGWDTITYAMQRGLFNRVQTGVLSSIPVLAPSFIEYWSIPSRVNQIAAIAPHVSNYFDFANFHTYDTGNDSSTMFPGSHYDITGWRLDTIRHSKPWVITEAGYENAKYSNFPTDTSYKWYGNHYLSELASAKYYSVLFMENFARGAKSIYTYEFIDQNTSDSSDKEKNFGLLHTDGTEKPAFTVIKNTLQLFKDTGAAFSPAPLSFTLSGDTSGIKYAVYQKLNGDYLIALWQGRTKGICYDFITFTDLPPDSQAVQITLPYNFSVANIYQPLFSGFPIFTYGYNNVLNLDVPDHLLVAEIKTNTSDPNVNGRFNEQGITIYPNPANDKVYVNGLRNENEQYFIYATDGRLVGQGFTGKNKPEINCAELTSGYYILKLTNSNGVAHFVTGISVVR